MRVQTAIDGIFKLADPYVEIQFSVVWREVADVDLLAAADFLTFPVVGIGITFIFCGRRPVSNPVLSLLPDCGAA